MKPLPHTDSSWTLFLDRDGVINEEKYPDYILNKSEFRFIPHALEGIALLSALFARIIVLTNQRAVAKKLMTLEDLEDIHRLMLGKIQAANGKIDKIYYCTDLDDSSINRKPNPGMAWQARLDFPEIDFKKSVMAGNTGSDMQLGRNIGAFTVLIPSGHPGANPDAPQVDIVYPDLLSLAKAFQKTR